MPERDRQRGLRRTPVRAVDAATGGVSGESGYPDTRWTRVESIGQRIRAARGYSNSGKVDGKVCHVVARFDVHTGFRVLLALPSAMPSSSDWHGQRADPGTEGPQHSDMYVGSVGGAD